MRAAIQRLICTLRCRTAMGKMSIKLPQRDTIELRQFVLFRTSTSVKKYWTFQNAHFNVEE